jgi:hypothetical protein
MKFPALLYSKFLNNWQGSWTAEEYELFDGIMRMAETNHDGDYKYWLKGCGDLETLKTRHATLVDKMVEQNRHIFDDGFTDYAAPYPEPPIKGTETIVPVRNYQDLIDESEQQHHCVATYRGSIVNGRYFVYKILEPERATLGITILNMNNGKVSLRIDQLRGFKNHKVNEETEKFVLSWFYEKADSTPKCNPSYHAASSN